jgi:hypothetical protein
VAAIVLVTYFVGAYEGIKPSYSSREFNLDGFVHYTEYEKIAKEEALKIPYDENDSFQEKVDKCNYDSQLKTVVNDLKKAISDLKASGGDAQEIADLEALQKKASMKVYSMDSEEEFVKKFIEEFLGFEEEPLMENGSYEFYFDRKWTTFKVVEKRTGNTWYSNPQEKDPKANNQQKSLINIYYAGALGGTTLWDSYTYAISDTDRTGESALTPNFQMKEIKDASGNVTALQVYYYFEQRGIDYVFFPKFISSSKIKANEDLDLSIEEELPELYLRNKVNSTNGMWEEVASLSEATATDSIQATDNTTWYAGNGEPNSEEGINGNYYVDLDTATIYVKTNKKTVDKNDGVSFKEVDSS